MLDKLEADLGELVETEIEDSQTEDDDGTLATAAAGTWNVVSFGLGLHDNEETTSGTFAMDLFSSSVTLSADGAAVTANQTAIQLDTFVNFNFDNQGLTNIYNEIDINTDGEGEIFEGTLDTNGNLTLDVPFEEDLETDECPSVGWRYPASKFIFGNTGNDNGLITVNSDVGVRYNTVDTNQDQCADAIDPNDKDGDEASQEMLLLLKGGSNLSNASLDGNYGFITLVSDVFTSGNGIRVTSSVGSAAFDGQGTATVPADGLDEIGFGRYPGSNGGAIIQSDGDGTSGGFPVSYSVTSSGKTNLATETGLDGWLNDDASLMALLDVNTTGGDIITEHSQEILLGIKLPSSTPVLEGSVYRLYPMIFGAGTNGFMVITTLGRSNTLTFGATTASLSGKVRGYVRPSETGPISSFSEDDSSELTVDSLGSNGAVSMSLIESNSTTYVKGFVSDDGNNMVLRIYEEGTTERLIGIILAVKQ